MLVFAGRDHSWRKGMAVKQAKPKSAAKQSSSARTTKTSPKSQSSKKRSAPGLMSKAKKVARAVVAGAATGAVQGAVEAGKEATGIGKKGVQARPPRRS